MRIEELSDQEFNEYAKQFDTESDNKEFIESLMAELDKISDEIGKCEKKIDNIKNLFRGREITKAYDSCVSLSKKLSKISTRSAMIPANYGIKDKIEYIANTVVQKKDVQFQYDDGIVVIQLPELLPHRPQIDTSTGKIKYYYDAETWKAAYYQAFQKEFEFGKHRMPEGKVKISFLHHVTAENPPDMDNLEIKLIIDIITNFLLIDDSYKYVCYFMDMIEDERNYTEIYISSVS